MTVIDLGYTSNQLTSRKGRGAPGGHKMAQNPELTVVFLHQVEAGQTFYCTPAEKRAWVRLSPAGQNGRASCEIPVQRDGLTTHMNGMSQVWVQPEHAVG